MADTTSSPAPVIDQRVAPRGVLPRHTQTWLMVGVAVSIIAIIVFAGHPEPTGPSTTLAAAAPLAPNPERLRDFQDRLRVMDTRVREQAAGPTDPGFMTMRQPAYGETATAAVDPMEVERKRRDYESLFASNVVVSRRPEGQQLIAMAGRARETLPVDLTSEALAGGPSIDEVADAVVRATTRYASGPPPAAAFGNPVPGGVASSASAETAKARPVATGPISSTGPLHRLLEGTVIDAVLTNRLDGSVAAPVNALVTNAVYSHDGQYVVIPAGSRVVGETTPVQSVGESRLAVTFHRLVLPDGRTYILDRVTGLNQVGDAGLHDQVNRHYWSTLGASGAVGLISGLAQTLGTAGFGGDGDRTIVIAGGLGNATSQATGQTMNRFLNRLPTITIREGHRLKVYLTADLELPAYQSPGTTPGLRSAALLAGGRP